MTETSSNTSINFKANANFSDFKKDINSAKTQVANSPVKNQVDGTSSVSNIAEISSEQIKLQPQPQADVYEPKKHKSSFLGKLKSNAVLRTIAVGIVSMLAVNLIMNLIGARKGKHSFAQTDKQLSDIWKDVKGVMPLEDMALSGEGEKLINELNAKVNFPDKIVEAGGGVSNSGILLHGPAGTGKTSIAKAIARHFPGSKFAVVDVTNLGSEYQSVTERNLNNAFNLICKTAKENPKEKIFVFFDEIDTIMMEDKGSGSAKHTNDIMNVFKRGFVEQLGQCDNVIPIGATNFEVDMEKAVANGKQLNKEMLDRFGSIYHIDLPSKKQFINAIKKSYDDKSVSGELLGGEKLDIIADFMHEHKMSFRDLNVIKNRAAVKAVNNNSEKPLTGVNEFFEGIKSRKEKFALAPGETDKDAVLNELAAKLGVTA